MANKQGNMACPICSVFKTISFRRLTASTGLAFLCVGMLLGIFILPLVLVPVGIVCMLLALAVPKSKWLCRECGARFNV